MKPLKTGRLRKSTNSIIFIGKRTGKLYVFVKNKLKYKKVAHL